MPSPERSSLEHSLSRMNQALVQRHAAPGPVPHRSVLDLPTAASTAGTAALVALGLVTGSFWLLIPAAGLGVFAGLTLGQRLARKSLTGGGTRAHIGMGASVAGDAVVEPGAAVEMGASVGPGAVVRAGAVVRMGASVGARAVLEPGSVVSWGASVGEGAVVGEGSTIGSGADVADGARVPAHATIWAGSSVGAGVGTTALPVTTSPTDPRVARLQAACDRLEAELRAAPESVRDFLGDPAATIGALRRSCEDLLRRELALREEASPTSLSHLDQERAELAGKLERSADEAVRRSLAGALAAIDEQRRQRELLGRHADRLEAEQTRLLYTLEGMAAQVVRVRNAGAEAGLAPTGELETSVAQLRSELDAIADSLEEVARPQAMARISEPPADPSDPSRPGERLRG